MKITTNDYRLASRQLIAADTSEITLAPIHPREFDFIPGQHLELELAGERRSFSIASAPQANSALKIAFRHSPSAFKQNLLAAPLGTPLVVQGPYGVFTLPREVKSAAFIAGGIGITPFRAMLEAIQNQSVPHQMLNLLYANHAPASAAYLPELRAWAAAGRVNLREHYGRIDAATINGLVRASRAELYFIAGPVVMTNVALELLLAAGVARGQILIEQFTGY